MSFKQPSEQSPASKEQAARDNSQSAQPNPNSSVQAVPVKTQELSPADKLFQAREKEWNVVMASEGVVEPDDNGDGLGER